MSKVLLVNDSKFESLVLKDMLLSLGHDVQLSDENDCLQYVASYDPEVVIANLTMGGVTGDVLLEAIKLKHPEIQCVLSSCSDIRPEDFHGKNVDAVFRTPTRPAQLKQALSEAGESIHDNAAAALEKEAAIETLFSDDGSQPEQESTARASYAFCPFCGNRLPSTSTSFVFCPMCGGKL